MENKRKLNSIEKIEEMFAEDINDLTNFQYRVLGTISEPKLERVK